VHCAFQQCMHELARFIPINSASRHVHAFMAFMHTHPSMMGSTSCSGCLQDESSASAASKSGQVPPTCSHVCLASSGRVPEDARELRKHPPEGEAPCRRPGQHQRRRRKLLLCLRLDLDSLVCELVQHDVELWQGSLHEAAALCALCCREYVCAQRCCFACSFAKALSCLMC
jgi:hypothetical protein